jgi:hypothetical protein
MLRFYHRYLGLEAFVGAGFLLAVAGLGLDVVLAIDDLEGLNRLGVAAMAQSLIIVGVNVGLVGALSSMLEER